MPDISYRDQLATTEYLVNCIERRLAGRDEPECLDQLPGDQYHIGVLAPLQNTGDAISQPDESPQSEVPATTPEAVTAQNISPQGSPSSERTRLLEDVPPDEQSQPDIENEEAERLNREDLLNRRGAPCAIGAEFMIADSLVENIRLTFEIHFSFYTRRFPTWEQQQARLRQDLINDTTPLVVGRGQISIRDRYVRHSVIVQPFSIELATNRRTRRIVEENFSERIQDILDAEKDLSDAWRKLNRATLPSSAFTNEAAYQQALRAMIDKYEIDLPPIRTHLDIRTAPLADGRLRIGAYLVNRTPAAETATANATRFIIDAQLSCRIETGRLVPLEIVAAPKDYQYDARIWAVGQGCAVEVDEDQMLIRTQGLAKYNQFRLTTKDDPPAPFAALKDEPIQLLNTIHAGMLNYAANWEQKIETGEFALDTGEIQACRNDLNAFRAESERFQSGIQALEADDLLQTAFKAMHRVFERVGLNRGIDRWRLFQICFIVTQLPSLAIREGKVNSDTLEYADVLWFPTGGGKTEAYLGLITCTLLYDRLRGKNSGVSTWLRFPLRMLSVQQLQRAVRVLYETEQERQALLGERAKLSDPISLGYFVGKNSTPNQLTSRAWAGQWNLNDLAARKELRDRLRLIRVCPRCSQPRVELEVNTTELRLRHICQNCKLDLNIFVSDDEIYRYLPSVLVGTVDKLAAVAWRRQFSHLWGGASWRCPKHGYSSGRYCIVYGCDVKESARTSIALYDPVPALQIQDELHLLREELGTFAGHYETLSTACQQQRGLRSKVIAATATVEGVDRQTRHLYAMPARRFPGRGYALGESFYTRYAQEGEEIRIARRYVAFRSQFLRSPDAAVRVLGLLHQEIRNLYLRIENEEPATVIRLLGLTNAQNRDDVLALLDKYDTTLTYVGTKADGGRIKRTLDDVVSRVIPRAGVRQMESVYLSGESTIDEIAEAVDELERPPDEWDDPERLDAVVGTSLISHGVDVTRFNIMVMSGMPGRTAEYIQSSSRSGRQYIGLVVVALSPWLLREQSLYHRFIAYHRNMERLVEPVPINRFSRFAIERTMPGMLAGVFNADIGPQIDRELVKVNAVERALDDGLLTEDGLRDRVREAFAVASQVYAPGLLAALDERVRERFRIEMRSIRAPGSTDRVTDALTRKPMTSLRDVDDPVPFDPREYSWYALRWIDRQ